MKQSKSFFYFLFLFLVLIFIITPVSGARDISSQVDTVSMDDQVSNPRELLKNNVEKVDEDKSIVSLVHYIWTEQKFLLLANSLFLVSLLILFILFYRSKPSVKKDDIAYDIKIDKQIKVKTHSTFLQSMRDKFLAKLYDRMDNFENTFKLLSEKIIDLENNNTDLLNKYNYELAPDIRRISADVTKTIYDTFLTSVGLKAANSLAHYENYVNCFDSEKEFALFNHITLEKLASLVGSYANIVAIGTYSDLLVHLLKKGVAIKPSIGMNIQNYPNDNVYVPPALIPVVTNKTDAVVVTNPYLSSLFINDEKILISLKDKIEEIILLPVKLPIVKFFVEWQGFGGVEKSSNSIWRWSVGFDKPSKCLIFNTGSQPVNMKINLGLRSAHSSGHLLIKIGAGVHEFELSSGLLTAMLELNLPPGRTEMFFDFKGKNELLNSDKRELKFAISDMRININGNGQISVDDIYSTSSSRSPYAVDEVTRKRLHLAGFFTIKAEIMANKSLYSKCLQATSFNLFNNYSNLSADDMLTFAQESGNNEVTILYTCYRKKLWE